MRKFTLRLFALAIAVATLVAGISQVSIAKGFRDQDNQNKRKLNVPGKPRHGRDIPRRKRRGIRRSYRRAGVSAGRGGKRFGRHIAHGRPIKGGKEFGKGMGGFGKHTGKGTAGVGKKVGRKVKHAVTP